MKETVKSYSITIDKTESAIKYCTCGCGKIIDNNAWGLTINCEGSLNSIENCYDVVKYYEQKVKELSEVTEVCKSCGKCCNHGPEISSIEKQHLVQTYPQYKDHYESIKPCAPCLLSNNEHARCILPQYARPLQCRILYCAAQISGFENFYNFLGDYLGWSKI